MPIFETHCHLNHRQFENDRQAAIERARAAGVTEFLVIGYDLESSRKAVELADPEAGFYAAVGIHPHDAEAWSAAAEQELRDLALRPGVVAIGEIGLDFYRNLSPREAQYAAFQAQLELAAELELPYVVHTRESVSPSLDVLEPFARRGVRGIMHCWSGTPEEARRARELGLLLGIGGVLTYKNPGGLPEAVAEAALEELVLETDCPYLTPMPHRGKRNEPAYLPLVASRIAEIRGISVDEVCDVTTRTARSLLLPRP